MHLRLDEGGGSVSVDDIDGDGDLDILVSSRWRVVVHEAIAPGVYDAPVVYPIGE